MEAPVFIAAFTLDQAARLTGVTRAQLMNWDRDKFFVPSLAYEERKRPYSRLYSFRDLVCLRVLNTLRNESKVPLSHLKEVKEALAHLGDDMWAKTTLYVLERRVVFRNPETDTREEVVSGQLILQIPLKVVAGDMERSIGRLSERDHSVIGKFERHPHISSGQTVIAGTRIPVETIKNFANAGYSIQAIRNEYPTLTDADIQAALEHVEAA